MTSSPDSQAEFHLDATGASAKRDHLPVIDLASSGPLPDLPDLSTGPVLPPWRRGLTHFGQRFARKDTSSAGEAISKEFWLDGDVLMCACPDCGAPMTVRLWLMVADCWRCETSIELTEEQEREVRRILEHHTSQAVVAPQALRPAEPMAEVGVTASAAIAEGSGGTITALPRTRRRPRVTHEPSAPPRVGTAPNQRRVRRPAGNRVPNWLHRLLKNMPAWLISLLFHIILLTILGLITSDKNEGGYITLSSRVSRIVRTGGDTRIVDPTDNSVFDLGVPDAVDLSDPAMRRAIARADQQARELRLTNPNNPYVPDLAKVRQAIHATPRRTLAARDPRVRVDMVRHEGGTTLTEAAVARGLQWLARHQSEDGSWSLNRFHKVGNCNCGQRGSISSDAAGTSLALLPFLGAGQTHLSGIYQDHVARALRWLLQHQEANGDLRGSSRQYPGMYAHGQATIVLCEAFLMTGDEQLRIPAQKAVDFIVSAQYADGGWRYYPRKGARSPRGDTSVLGWQLMALQSALAADLSVPEATLENASHFLDQVQRADGALYCYLPREDHSAPMTAEGLLCRIYLGWKQNHPALQAGVSWMLENEPPDADHPNIYYWYYATQTMHHFGGQPWQEWNLQMRDVLVSTQETRGHAAGSWAPDGPLTSQGGRLYMTALAVCCLEVYYRHLPLFRRIDLE